MLFEMVINYALSTLLSVQIVKWLVHTVYFYYRNNFVRSRSLSMGPIPGYPHVFHPDIGGNSARDTRVNFTPSLRGCAHGELLSTLRYIV